MYLVVETKTETQEFTHFIRLDKDFVKDEIESFIKHLYWKQNQVVTKVYFSKTALSNW